VDRGRARAVPRAARRPGPLQAAARPREASRRVAARRRGDDRRRRENAYAPPLGPGRKGGGHMSKRKRAAGAVVLTAAIAAAVATAGGSAAPTKGGGSGILRLGTTNYIDSLNPFNYIEAQALNAMIMIYPQLVAYKSGPEGYVITGDLAKSWSESNGGKTWTFKLHGGTKWSDGKPLTAADAAWSVNTTLKYQKGPTAVEAPSVAHATGASAPNPTTLVIRYEQPVGNVLSQLATFSIVPEHVYAPLAVNGGKGIKTFHPE